MTLASKILANHGSLPIGKMGSLLHKAANNHLLPSILKERYGGLKKFLTSNEEFVLGTDHPYNPHVRLRANIPAAASVSIAATHPDSVIHSLDSPLPALSPSKVVNQKKRNSDIIDPSTYSNLTPILALHCEIVGTGPDGISSKLAR